jgi:hypothetical protein
VRLALVAASGNEGRRREREVALVKRIIVLLVVATLMLAMSALPALATNFGKEGGGPPLFSGNLGPENSGALVLHCQVGGGKSVVVFNKRDEVRGNCRDL